MSDQRSHWGARQQLLIGLIWLGGAGAISAQRPTVATVTAKAHAYMLDEVRHGHFSGVVVIARQGKVVTQRSYGLANLELGVPVTPRSVFLIGSLTKQFTSTAILLLRDRGQLALTDSICRHLETCPKSWEAITIHHLLSHTSGIRNFSGLPAWDDSISMRRFDRDGAIPYIRDLPLQFQPGEGYRYTNSGYYLLGQIIERVSGLTYGEFLRQHLFEPAGMASTRVEDGRSLIAHRATGYYRAGGGWVNALPQNVLLSLGAGGIWSTAGDLLRWDSVLTGNGLLSTASRREMFTPVRNEYGLGWELRRVHGRTSTTHSGSQFGYSSYLMRFPEERMTIVVLSNSDDASATRVATNLAAIALGLPYRHPKAQLFDILAATIRDRGAAAGIARYRTLKAAEPGIQEVGEELLNDLGYDFLEVGKVADAVAIFSFAVEEYPRAANLHDSLGEAYMLQGAYRRAITSYERSLELDPSNTNAVSRLKALQARIGSAAREDGR